MNLLDGLSGEIGTDGYREDMADATVRFETAGVILKSVVDELNEKHDIVLVD